MAEQTEMLIDAVASAVLTGEEARKLASLEEVIESGVSTFRKIGLALLEIRDTRLYRATHATFDDYLVARWGIHRSHAHRMIEAAKAARVIESSLSPDGGQALSPAPKSERQVRPLTKLTPEGQTQAWGRAVRESGGKQPLAETVERCVDEVARTSPELVRDRARQAREALHSSESAEWYSPAPPVEAARELMGGIDLDPASSPEANELVGATHIFTAEDDGLSKPWRGRLFLNWPGGRDEDEKSNAVQWSAKAVDEYEHGDVVEAVVLVFNAATGAIWFQRFWDYPICFVRGRMAFRKPGGVVGGQPTHSNAIVYLGPQVERFVEVFSRFGRIVLPAGREGVSHAA
jgi:hypothetical protein